MPIRPTEREAVAEASPLPDLARAEGFRAGWRTAEENVHPMMAWGEPELDWDIDLESALAAYLAACRQEQPCRT